MAFDHKKYNSIFLQEAQKGALVLPESKYGVRLVRANPAQGDAYYKCIGVHHLLPDENVGKHNVYLEVLDENGNRINGALIGWDWVGRRATEPISPIRLDKPLNEPGADIAMYGGQNVSVWVINARSDKVENMHTYHPDEGSGNTIGHHSFYVVFQRTRAGATVPPPPPPVVEPPPPPPDPETPPATSLNRTAKVFDDGQMRIYLVIEVYGNPK